MKTGLCMTAMDQIFFLFNHNHLLFQPCMSDILTNIASTLKQKVNQLC